jgi:hypothetical protein
MPSPGASAIAPAQWLAGLPREKGKHLCQHGHTLLLPLHLRQGGLCLGQPEGHLHTSVHFDSRRQYSTGLLSPVDLGIECAEAQVTVRLERAHAEFLSQDESLLVVGFGLRDIRGICVGMDGAKLVERVRLVPTFLELPGHVKRLAGALPGLLAVARQTTDLAELCDPEGLMLPSACANIFADGFLQQRAPLRKAIGIKRTA